MCAERARTPEARSASTAVWFALVENNFCWALRWAEPAEPAVEHCVIAPAAKRKHMSPTGAGNGNVACKPDATAEAAAVYV